MPARGRNTGNRVRRQETARSSRERRLDPLFLVALVVVTLAVFAGSVAGDWVYDDESQIVANHYIQDPSFYGSALVSDVWVFMRDPDRAASNYWRPTFVAWLIVRATQTPLDARALA